MTTPDLDLIADALAVEWEAQRRSFNGSTFRQCIHCQGTTASGHDADCVGEVARAALARLRNPTTQPKE